MTEQVRTSEQAYNDIPQCNSDEGGKDPPLFSNSYLRRLYFRPTARKGISSLFFFQNAVIQATLFLIKELDFVEKNAQYLSKF